MHSSLIKNSLIVFLSFFILSCSQKEREAQVLVFSKTTGFRHESIGEGVRAIMKLGKENNFKVDTTEDAAKFTEDNLKRYSAIVFLSTTGDVLNYQQQNDLERYIQAGGGFVGVHAAADTEYDWLWYNKLVGGYFDGHPTNPNVRKGMIYIVDHKHPSTKELPDKLERTDEFYNFKSISPDIKILLKVDEKSYGGGKHGENHPLAWYHEFDGGRSFYTNWGHTKESFKEPVVLKHLLGGIQYAIGENKELEYHKAKSVRIPEENRFTKITYAENLDEPMGLVVASDGRIFFVERKGKVKMFDQASKKMTVIGTLPTRPELGNGLIGITLDPNFDKNNHMYFFYTVGDTSNLKHRISRIDFGRNNQLDLTTEKTIIEIPIELESGAHTGGSLSFDPHGDFFISVGDNTVPFKSDGFSPLDERAGRKPFDAQRSSANTQDLRGKILRISLNEDGSYGIPEGNLFPKDGSEGRPEIFIMGCRNPYRISIDSKTGAIFWGEVGPDSGKDSARYGPRGYDEINQARKPGNYGWPYFIADNKPYRKRDFATDSIVATFDPKAPVNNSVNNTGAKNLPPAQKPLLWYPYSNSEEFPELGKGGRTAMAGPVYYFDSKLNSKMKLPGYYDKTLFIYEWMRNWIMAVRLDENGNYLKMEPFVPNLTFDHPIDLELGPDGALYLIEYGPIWYSQNKTATLSKIIYTEENRAPLIKAYASDTMGSIPLKVKFSAHAIDFDNDSMVYEWKFTGNKIQSRERNPEFTFTQEGVYNTTLTVTDAKGSSTAFPIEIHAGNSKPKVAIEMNVNRSFYWDNEQIDYKIKASDKEDGKIDPSRLKVFLNYLPEGKDIIEVAMGHQEAKAPLLEKIDHVLINKSDCKACHSLKQKSVGPAFFEIAKKYKDVRGAASMLAKKVVKGGGGVWGDHAMSAHPQIMEYEAEDMVRYILNLNTGEDLTIKKTVPKIILPAQGKFIADKHIGSEQGTYILTASYTDKGGKMIAPMTESKSITIRNPRVQAEDYDTFKDVEINKRDQEPYVFKIHGGTYISFKNIDLKGIKNIIYAYAMQDKQMKVEVHVDSPTGPIISSIGLEPTGSWAAWKNANAQIEDPGGVHELFFVFKNDKEKYQKYMMNLNWIYFNRDSMN